MHSSGFFLPLHCFIFLFCPLSLLLLKFDLYCESAMIYCRVFLLVRFMLLQISNLYAEGISKLGGTSSWKDAKPAFTCDLWHSRCMEEYFTMTAHWIEIRGGELSPQWVLRQRVLGAFPVQDASIDHQGECQNMLNIQQLYPHGESILLPMAMISTAFLSTFPGTWHTHLMLLIILFLA